MKSRADSGAEAAPATATEFTIGERRPQAGGAVVLALGGHLDVEGSPRLQQALAELLAQGARDVELDCTSVGFISSVGVGVLIVAVGDFRAAGGDIAVSGLNAELRHMFEMLELTDYVTLR